MTQFFRAAVSAVLVLFATPTLVEAQDFQKGLAAAQAGDFETALKNWRPLAEQGDADAQFNLGLMYENGEGVPEDFAEALRWYRLAAEQGHAIAQLNLGVMYDYGRGVPEDDAAAVRWYRLAAEQGNAQAQYQLGNMYRRSEGVPADDAKAVRWYRRAADQGHARAQNNLAWVLYVSGNYDEALKMADLAVNMRPDNADAIDTRAHILAAIDRPDDAVSEFERAIKFGGSDQVGAYQEALLKHDYDIGAPDGKYGEQTRKALIDCINASCRLLE